eukprot:PITA_26363
MYEAQNTNRVLALKGKLFALKMDENESVGGFMARVKDLKDKLGAIGENVSDSDLVTLTLNRMTDEYQTFIFGLSAREKAPSFDDLTAILLQEEERRQNLKTQGNDLALMAKRRQYRGKQHQHQHQHQQQQKGANSFQKRPFRGMTDSYVKRCFYCGKPGHQIKECYKRQADERKGKQRKHQGCFAGEEDDHSHDLRLFTVDCALSASKEDEDNIWYVDSGASSHMTGKRDCFEFLEESACGSKIYLRDDSGYEIKGCGDIPVKLPSGDIKHLRNVLYVPGIKKNLIFVSMITDQDMQVKFFKNGCVIQDSQLEIVATGVRVGNLYRLDARSMPQQAMVATTSTVENLWHQRFGHLNLQDLILLKKKGYSDSDWAGNLDDRRSITGYAFSIGSGVISWSSKKQSTIALSSCEAEYQVLCAATCKPIWLRRLLSDTGEGQKEATSIKTDNQSTIKLAYNPVFHKNTKHIDTQFPFVREKIQSKEICVDYCNTCDNVADIFTKPLGRTKFELFRGMLGVKNNPFSIKGGS